MDSLTLIVKSHEGDKEAREQVINDNKGLVWSTVKRFSGRGTETDDLFQIGMIGLIKAVDRFDVSFGVQFSTYAVPLISGEIKRFLRDDGMIKVSRTLKENGQKIRRTEEMLIGELGREPDIGELSEATGLSKEDIVLSLEANMEVESIYKTVNFGDGGEVYVLDRLCSDCDSQDEIVNNLALKQAMMELTEKERILIKMRFYDNLTQREVAEKFNVSQVQISRLEKKILNFLNKQLER